MANIALFSHDPHCSDDCIEGMLNALLPDHNITVFNQNELSENFLEHFDVIAFPGGTGDACKFNEIFHWRQCLYIENFLRRGGRYLGICMGAYWAGRWYFDFLRDLEPVQYIKQPGAVVKRSYGTTVPVKWKERDEIMFFYDGCTFNGNISNTKVIATYPNGEPAAIIQGRLGLIGPHPESAQKWYKQFKSMGQYWHDGRHHILLRKFVNELLNEPL